MANIVHTTPPVDVEGQETFLQEKPQCEAQSRERRYLVGAIVICSLLSLIAFTLLTFGRSTVLTEEVSHASHRQLGSRVKIGFCSPESLSSLESKLGGAHVDIWMRFQAIGAASSLKYEMQNQFNSGRDIVLVLKFDSTLNDINSGRYDNDIKNFASMVNSMSLKGRTLWLRPLHEFNGDWYPYGIYTNGNTKDGFKLAYRRIVTQLKSQIHNGPVRYQLAYNCENAYGHQYDSFNDMYPGGDIVDMVLCSAYNRFRTSQWHTQYESFRDVFKGGYDRMQRIGSGKPLGVGETNSVSWGGNRGDWYRNAMASMKDQFYNVAQMNFFLYDKDGDWSLKSTDDWLGMKDAIYAAP